MKRLFIYLNLLIGITFICNTSFGAVPDYSDYARLLKTYVVEDGVRYSVWVKEEDDLTALQAFVEQLGEINVYELTLEDQTAFYINLYNAAMLQIVLEAYPIKSIKTMGLLPFSIFKQKIIRQNDEMLSLDNIEKDILLKKYFDPRIHFAVNCASESCPPLLDEPFTGNRLNQQLDMQTRLFAKSDRAVRVNEEKKEIAFSKLFEWYAKDFDVKTPAEYLNRYRKIALPMNYSVEWIPYDWSLNAEDKR